MKPSEARQISKFLSYVLRHRPDSIGLRLDPEGWAGVDELVEKTNARAEGITLNRERLREVVETNDKRRFTLSGDGARIRAAQGHSVQVNLDLQPAEPPEHLFHGTATRFLESILREGLLPQQRRYVHLSKDRATAVEVGRRYGKPVVLTVDARAMHERGFLFYLAENGVWLTDSVPPDFLRHSAD